MSKKPDPSTKRVGLSRSNPTLGALPQGSFQAAGQSPIPAMPASPIPGIQGNLPLPTGQPIQVNPQSMTAQERAVLELLGWREGQAIPSDFAQHVNTAGLQQAQQAAYLDATDTSRMPPPARPDLPPLQMPVLQELEDLSEAERARLQQVLANAQQQAQQFPQPSQMHTQDQGVRQAAGGHTDIELQLENDLPLHPAQTAGRAVAGSSRAASQAPAQSAPGSSPPPATQTAGPQFCPRCQHDLSLPDTVVITEQDQISFLETTLGGQLWEHAFPAFGGQLVLTVRDLHPDEAEACSTQAFAELRRGRFQALADAWRQIVQYQVCLQLVSLRTSKSLFVFPGSLKEWAAEADPPAAGDPTVLPQIEAHLRREVLTTGSLFRIATTLVSDFNRKIAKLEAQLYNADFPKAAPPSA